MITKTDLKKYGISDAAEIVYNPSYDELFREIGRASCRERV